MLCGGSECRLFTIYSSIIHTGIIIAEIVLFYAGFSFYAKSYIALVKLGISLSVIWLIILATVTMLTF